MDNHSPALDVGLMFLVAVIAYMTLGLLARIEQHIRPTHFPRVIRFLLAHCVFAGVSVGTIAILNVFFFKLSVLGVFGFGYGLAAAASFLVLIQKRVGTGIPLLDTFLAVEAQKLDRETFLGILSVFAVMIPISIIALVWLISQG